MMYTIYTPKTDIRMEIEYFLPLCKFDLDKQSYLSTRNKPFFAWDSPLQRYSKKFKKRVEKKKFTSCIFIATLIYHIRHTISRQKMLRNQKIAWTFFKTLKRVILKSEFNPFFYWPFCIAVLIDRWMLL